MIFATLLLALVVFMAIIISSLPLWLASKILGIKKSRFINAIIATIVGGIVAAIILLIVITVIYSPIIAFLAGLISYVWVVKEIYDVSWSKAFLLWLVSIITAIIIFIIISLLFMFLTIPLIHSVKWHMNLFS